MTVILRIACLSCLVTTLGFAGNWSGWLVDSKCYTSMDNNRGDIPSFVNWDGNLAIRYCTPYKKTKSFAVVGGQDATIYTLDSSGNEKAAQLPLSADKTFVYFVNVTGENSGSRLRVHLIAIIKRINREGAGAPGL